jgi:hypothetical protein
MTLNVLFEPSYHNDFVQNGACNERRAVYLIAAGCRSPLALNQIGLGMEDGLAHKGGRPLKPRAQQRSLESPPPNGVRRACVP